MDVTKSFPGQVLASAFATIMLLGAACLAAQIVSEHCKAVVDGVRDGLREK